MNLNASMQSFKDLFRFPFRDPRWQGKLLIGSLLALAGTVIPVIPTLPLLGYFARLLRSGARNEVAERLPEWDNWEELFVDGLRQFGVILILMLPGGLVMGIGWALYMGAVMAMPALEGRAAEGAAIFSMFSAMAIFFVAIAVGMLLMLVAALVLPPALAHVAVKREFGAFFRVNEWWAVLRANFGNFLVAWAVFGVIYTLLMIVTQILYLSIVLCLAIPLVIFPASVYAAWVMYRLIGQAYGQRGALEVPGDIAAAPAV